MCRLPLLKSWEVEERGGYDDQSSCPPWYGTNRTLQLLSLVAMDKPKKKISEQKKAKSIWAPRSANEEDLKRFFIHLWVQSPGKINSQYYHSEPNVNPQGLLRASGLSSLIATVSVIFFLLPNREAYQKNTHVNIVFSKWTQGEPLRPMSNRYIQPTEGMLNLNGRSWSSLIGSHLDGLSDRCYSVRLLQSYEKLIYDK